MPAKPTRELSGFSIVLIYSCMALAMGYGIVQLAVATEIFGSRAGAETTILAQRVASAREIKEALRKPQPKLEPLPPISSKLPKPETVKVASRERVYAPWAKVNSLSPAQIDAMVAGLTRPESSSGDVSLGYANDETSASSRRRTYSRTRYSEP